MPHNENRVGQATDRLTCLARVAVPAGKPGAAGTLKHLRCAEPIGQAVANNRLLNAASRIDLVISFARFVKSLGGAKRAADAVTRRSDDQQLLLATLAVVLQRDLSVRRLRTA